MRITRRLEGFGSPVRLVSFMSGLPFPSRRWNPFGDFEREVGRLLHAFPARRATRARVYPPLNLYETAVNYVLTVEVPGMDSESLDLSLTGETLTIRGERKRPELIPEESYRRQERPFGRWTRTITFPGRVDGSKVSAHYAHGVLTVTLAKAEENRPRQITVSTSP